MRNLIELSAQVIELFAVAIILIPMVNGTLRYLIHLQREVGWERRCCWVWSFWWPPTSSKLWHWNSAYRTIIILGLLVIIRTFLSWSLVVEIEGRWPWKSVEGRVTSVE